MLVFDMQMFLICHIEIIWSEPRRFLKKLLNLDMPELCIYYVHLVAFNLVFIIKWSLYLWNGYCNAESEKKLNTHKYVNNHTNCGIFGKTTVSNAKDIKD